MNYDAVTLEDCLRLYEFRGSRTVIEDGRVTGFEE